MAWSYCPGIDTNVGIFDHAIAHGAGAELMAILGGVVDVHSLNSTGKRSITCPTVGVQVVKLLGYHHGCAETAKQDC